MRAQTVSKMVSATGYVEEAILKFVHSEQVPWLLPGVKATNKFVVLPLVCAVSPVWLKERDTN
jgi:hypothetical protein